MVYIVVFALAAVIALIQLVVIANPKISMSVQYDTKKNDDGNYSIKRNPIYIIVCVIDGFIALKKLP